MGLDAFGYSLTIAVVLGILGNILVILSILRQKKNVLKNNYYYDLVVDHHPSWYCLLRLAQSTLFAHPSVKICHFCADAFQLTGVSMMLIILLLRYRATEHPLKPAISRRKWKVVCGLLYLVGLIAACGTGLPLCFIKSNAVYGAHQKYYRASAVFFVYIFPTIFMVVVYYKIGRSLMKKKHMKRICSNVMRQREPDSFNILRYIRNRRTFRLSQHCSLLRNFMCCSFISDVNVGYH